MIQQNRPDQEFSGCRPGAYAVQLAARNKELREEIQRRKEVEDQLRRTQADLQRARDRYMDLFELSPVGYVGLDEEGSMRDINLTAARLLGSCRADLIGNPFSNCLSPEYRASFQQFLAECFRDRNRHACTVSLNGSHTTPHVVHLASTVTPDLEHGGLLCRLALIDLAATNDLPPLIQGPVTF